ncbi:hypothetical protein [Microbacterium sp. RURRCA19A]|uniref:hypothetical protein n=1 Tax=Microbacterium sp. RURRCA19A TaxID=1907391 RepID=UPI0011155ED4|nr:hypothetical protein [Microbacterium sp. RURRCA19A]
MNGSSSRFAAACVALGTITLIAGLAGCATSATAGVTPTSVQSDTTAASTSPSTQIQVTDHDSCVALEDVFTIVQNAGMGLKSGSMGQHEYDGWLQLATRVLDRVPTRGDGNVSASIAALKKIAPPVSDPAGGSTGIATREWNADAVGSACQAAGTPLAAQSFTGG